MEYQTGLFFLQPLFALAFNILMVIYRLVGENLGLAIIVFTIVLKLATLPFSLKQVSSAEKNKEFQAKYKAIQAKYKVKDKNGKENQAEKEKMTRELAQLQSEYLPGQLGGCLPMLLQIVFFFQVYYVVINLLNIGLASFEGARFSFVPAFAAEQSVNLNFLGMNLGQSAAQVGTGNLMALLPYAILIFLVGATQLISTRIMSGQSMLPGRKNKAAKDKQASTIQPKKNPDDVSFSDALQQSSQSMMYFLPVMTMLISISFPAGLSLYWTVTSGFAIIQQLIVKRAEVKVSFQKFWLRVTGKSALKVEAVRTENKVQKQKQKQKQKHR